MDAAFAAQYGPGAIFGAQYGSGSGIGGAGFEMRSTWHEPKRYPIRGNKRIEKEPVPVEIIDPERLEFEPVNDQLLQAMLSQWQAPQAAMRQPAPTEMEMMMAHTQLRAHARQRAHEDRKRRQQEDEDAILALLLH